MPRTRALRASPSDEALSVPPAGLRGGLAPGTLIHAKDGLTPIEQVRVGDWILSRALDGSDLLEYKRVTSVVSRPDVAVNLASWTGGHLVAAPDQLVRVAGRWKAVDKLVSTFSQMLLHSLDETPAAAATTLRLYVSASPSVAWVAQRHLSEKGCFFDLTTSTYLRDPDTPQYSKSDWFGVDLGRPPAAPKPADKFLATVYSIGVEDHGTCLVGKQGVLIAAMADAAFLDTRPGRGPALPYAGQVRLPLEKKRLATAELKKLVAAHLESVVVPLGFQRVKDRERVGDRHFMFEQATAAGRVTMSGFVLAYGGGHTLHADCSLFCEAVRQPLYEIFGEHPYWHTDGHCHLPLVGAHAHDADDRFRVKEGMSVDSLELLQPVLGGLGALAPRVAALAQTVAGVDRLLNGHDVLRPDWPLFQRTCRRRTYFPLVIAALAGNPEFDTVVESYREIISGRPEQFSMHPDTFTMDGLERLVAHLLSGHPGLVQGRAAVRP